MPTYYNEKEMIYPIGTGGPLFTNTSINGAKNINEPSLQEPASWLPFFKDAPKEKIKMPQKTFTERPKRKFNFED